RGRGLTAMGSARGRRDGDRNGQDEQGPAGVYAGRTQSYRELARRACASQAGGLVLRRRPGRGGLRQGRPGRREKLEGRRRQRGDRRRDVMPAPRPKGGRGKGGLM